MADKWEIPEKLRASSDPTDGEAHARLVEADREQERMAATQAPIPDTPTSRERSAAIITITALRGAANEGVELTEHQTEQLAEAFASSGEYRKATDLTNDDVKRTEWDQIADALEKDDDEWCAHPAKFIKAYVWSIPENRERPLLACNTCGFQNVAVEPENLLAARQARARVRGATKGMDMAGVLRYLKNG